MEKEYYAVRKGFIKKDEALSFDMFKKAFHLLYKRLEKEGYFQKYFGNDCVDGYVEGSLGDDIPTELLLKTGKQDLWPIFQKLEYYDEVALLTMIEVLHDFSSKPVDSYYHSFCDCGIHVKTSDDTSGKTTFRNLINPILKRFNNSELSVEGEILEALEEGFEPMFNASILTEDENIKSKITMAIKKFRRAVSTLGDRKDALRDLADVLEFLKGEIKSVGMNKDTTDLFNIANNFGIRHFNPKQKTEYDAGIWHSWMFYCCLSTIHASLRLIETQKKD